MPVISEKIELAREDSDELSDNTYEMRNRSAQEINSDELDGGLDCSDDESGVAQRKFVQANKAAWKMQDGQPIFAHKAETGETSDQGRVGATNNKGQL